MERTINEALEQLKDYEYYTPYQELISFVSDWIEQSQSNYETRLKADMVAMLTDIQLDIEELKTDYDKNLTSEHGIYYAYDKSSRIVQNYINALKEANDVDQT